MIHFISCGKIGIQKEYIWWRKLHHVTVSQVFSLRVKPACVLSCDTAQNVDKIKLLREQCFSVLLYIMLCKLVHANDSETIQTKTTEEYFSAVQFILLRKVVQTIHSVVQMLKCYRLTIRVSARWRAILSCQ